jgi:cytochrome b
VAPKPLHTVRIWDLPTRLFHWALAVLVLFSWISGQFGDRDWLEWHFRSGYLIFALIAFRLLWGFAGDRYARFASFRPSFVRAWTYLRSPAPAAGHNPLGALSVYALLLATGLQVITGLLSSDGEFTEGPWAIFVSERTVRLMSSLHSVNRWALLALVTVHLAAIVGYSVVRGKETTLAMLTGTRHGITVEPAADDLVIRLRAALLLALASLLVGYVVQL